MRRLRLSGQGPSDAQGSEWSVAPRNSAPSADNEGVIDIDEISRAAIHMEPLPMSVARLVALSGGAGNELAPIIEVVEFDPMLTSALLRAANSSWSAPREPITTARGAVVRLGAGPIVTLALGVHVRTRMSGAIPEYGLDEGELWLHSVAASLAAETLMRSAPNLPVETPTAALLHDLGKIVISRFLEADDLRALAVANEIGVPRIQTEREVLGLHHGELGGVIAQRWELPESLVAGITHHHEPLHADTPLSYGVYIADTIAKDVLGTLDDADPMTLGTALGAVGLTTEVLPLLCDQVRDRLGEVLDRFDSSRD
jgi:putative nucleotidyltransferase with HDIG domain